MVRFPSPSLPATVLVVDDDPTNLRLLQHLLSQQGYNVRVAASGREALELMERELPTAILLDILMPEFDGLETCQALKANPHTREIPVIFLSALNETFDKVKAFDIGGADYVTKPFEVAELLARIRHQVRLRTLQISLQEQNDRLNREIEARCRMEEELGLLLLATRAIERASTVSDALQAMLRTMGQTIGASSAQAWQPDAEGQRLERTTYVICDGNRPPSAVGEDCIPVAKGEGLPGRVWQSRCPEVEDHSGTSGAFGVPVLQREGLMAVLVFCLDESLGEDGDSSENLELVASVALQLGAALGQKRMESQLKETEERYRQLVENAAEGIYQATPTGQFLSVNAALARLYGYDSPEELVAEIENIDRQIYTDPQRRSEFVEQIEREGVVSEFESLVYRRDRSVLWISENARAVRDDRGRLLYYEGIVSDITTRKLAQEALKFQKEQTEQLLSNILPAAIAERLQTGQGTIADSFDEASILFADLVGFTKFAARKTPKEVVEVLNWIFSQFDRLCERYELEKIKTIGDAYMVAGGVPVPRDDSIEAMADLALAMQETLKRFCQETGEPLQLRVGIHLGPVVAGAIGLSKFAYDLWGDTVNTASRMESNGLPGRIQVTEVVRDRLQDKFEFERRGIIYVKGKGDTVAYFLLSRKARDSAVSPSLSKSLEIEALE
ncbi:adenylate/guanylate cyclase domain-containing protein [Baaleninema sp.]|uniref:adenylate/guanylate cyclase domain-containing protein n=1 Tax=Baaleninema sp. TaxID=3101197 RepID=UPI003D08112D